MNCVLEIKQPLTAAARFFSNFSCSCDDSTSTSEDIEIRARASTGRLQNPDCG